MLDKPGKEALDLLEKLTGLPYFMFLLSLAVFSDTYLLAKYGTTIRDVNSSWFNQHATLDEILTYLGCIGFFYAALVPGLRFFIGLLNIIWPNDDHPSSSDGWVRLNHLSEYAIINNNALAYKEYEKAIERVKSEKHLSGLCIALIILSVTGWLLSTENHKGLFNFVYSGITSFPPYAKWPLSIAIIPFLIFVVLFAIRAGSRYDDFVNLPNFKNWPTKLN